MIRSSKHVLKYQTNKKNNLLCNSLDLLKNQVQYYIQQICCVALPLKKNITSKELPNTFIMHSQWKQICYKQASEIIRSQIKFAANKRYRRYKKLYAKCFNDNVSKHPMFTNRRFSDLKLKDIIHTKYFTIPKVNNFSLNIDNRLFDVKQTTGEFDEFIHLRLPIFQQTKKLAVTVNIPIKYHRQSLKYNTWKRLNTIRLTSKNDMLFIEIVYEKDEPNKKNSGIVVGVDQGVKKLLSCSDGQYIGKDFESLINKVDRKKRNSNAYKRALIERTEYINRCCKLLDYLNIREIVGEDLKCLKNKTNLGRNTNRRHSYWLYPRVIQRLESLCQENGVLLTKVNPRYTSQTCSCCGIIDKTNRHGEVYHCKNCGLKIDADYNASINISLLGKYGTQCPKNDFIEIQRNL